MPRHRSRHRTLLAGMGLAVAAWLQGSALAQEIRLGQEMDLTRPGRAEDRLPLEGGTAAAPWTSHVMVSWSMLSGGVDQRFAAVERRIRRLRDAHHRVVLSLVPDRAAPLPSLDDSAALESRLAALRQVATLLGEHLVALEPLRQDGGNALVERDAYFLKRAAVAIRSAAPDVAVVLGLAGPGPFEAGLRELYAADVEPYVDAWAWHASGPGDRPDGGALRALRSLRLDLDPAAPLWVLGVTAEGAGERSAAAEVARLAPAGPELLTFDVEGPGRAVLENLHRRLGRGFVAMPSPGLDLVVDGVPVTDRFMTAGFFNSTTAMVETLVVPRAGAPDRVEAVLSTFDVSSPLLHDLQTGTDRFLGGAMPDPAANRTRLTLPGLSGASLLEYRRFAAAGVEREEIEIGQQRDPTVEEILSRYREVDDRQREEVRTVRADVRIEFHYSVAGAATAFDVTYNSRYFWSRESGGEFEHLEMLVNGARWKRDKLPDLPLIQPEKVVTTPLDIHLRRQYRYTLEGRDEVQGRPAWQVAFEPVEADAARYRGTVWIDRETFRLLRSNVVQTGLEVPVLSSEENNLYGEFTVPGDGVASLVRSMQGQQIWNTAGANFVVNREMDFSDVRINDEAFEETRAEAYQSPHQMLRDTDEGLRYLERDPSGKRVVKETVDSRTRLGLAGAFYNEALDFPVPFAGFSYFDYDFRKRRQQLTAFIAGAANWINWSDPSILGTRADATLSGSLIAFSSADRFFVGGREDEGLEVENRPQNVSASIGYPLSQFVRVRGWLTLDHQHYERSDDTRSGFVVPEDTFVLGVQSQVQFNRRGFNATLQSALFSRSDWEPWGDTDPDSTAVGSRRVDFDERFESYETWSAGVSQDIFLRTFQKIRLDATWLDGSDLDRFSQYRFGFFGSGPRVRGFSGSGIRFNRGLVTRGRYSFNIADLVSFDAGLDFARVRDTFDGGEDRSHTGIGFAGKFVGPWGLIFQLEYGYALRSAFEGVEGEQEAQLLLFKFF